MDDRGGVGGPPDRLRAQERDVAGTEAASRIRVAGQCVGELSTGRAAEKAALDDSRSEPEEDRFIDQRLDPMARNRGDEEVDRIRPEIDRRADDRCVEGRSGAGAFGAEVRLGRCRPRSFAVIAGRPERTSRSAPPRMTRRPSKPASWRVP
jgi:hypothetical protein